MRSWIPSLNTGARFLGELGACAVPPQRQSPPLSGPGGREKARRRRPNRLLAPMAGGQQRFSDEDFLPKQIEPWEGMVRSTISHYDQNAVSFWAGTKDHDVSTNTAALLAAMGEPLAGKHVLDFGCGPGRDTAYFLSQGLKVTGLDGSAEFVRMAAQTPGVQVLHQDFHKLDLPPQAYDGVFANAALFHVWRPLLPTVLSQLHAALAPGGILFSSNPRAEQDTENFSGRYGNYMCYETYARLMQDAGFEEVGHFYRPVGLPREQQPWLASTWRKLG